MLAQVGAPAFGREGNAQAAVTIIPHLSGSEGGPGEDKVTQK